MPRESAKRGRIGVLESVIYLKHKQYRSSRSVKSLHCLTNACFHSAPPDQSVPKVYSMLCIIISKSCGNEESKNRFWRVIAFPKYQTGFAWERRMKCPSSTTIQVESASCSFLLQFICSTAWAKNKDDFFFSLHFLHIHALSNIAPCWHLYLDNP